MKFTRVTDVSEFHTICKKYGLGYEKTKKEPLYSNKKIWVTYVTKCDYATERAMQRDNLYLKYVDGCFYPYIFRKEK